MGKQRDLPEASRDRHIPALDGIRGLAVLIVFIYHYGGGAQSANPLLRILGTIDHAGWCGVSLFFLLSGFLITRILWDGRGEQGWWKRFYWRRTLRIFPLYYAVLVVVFLSAVAAGNLGLVARHVWMFVFYLQNVPGLPWNWSQLGTPLVLSHFWSLAVEEQFYLIWPFVLVNMRSEKHARFACVCVFFGSVLFRLATWMTLPDLRGVVTSLPAHAGELAAGGFLAMSLRESRFWNALQRLAAPVLALGAAGFLASAAESGSFEASAPSIYLFGLPAVTVAFAGLLVLSRRKGVAQSFFELGPLRWLGRISYGIYIYHVLLGPFFYRLAHAFAPHASRNTQLGLTFFLAGGLTLLIAQLSFRYFETPFLRMKNRISQPKNQLIETKRNIEEPLA